ncbi:hypothetical protein BU14_0072s0073 [Porphyra umbilicalis]|uniref:HIG1 domain-containing protein n=1 Tax=Porphyra umbilicalis TaxID=2786 RepID=A0A1X6PG31_PORUM|nr:hypothetical protein BU14_0072s0073 [Porphyra umbilicalis]|eukprot:OSX79715.1 hypothetical protein BU14_0072s0073 [Porphyra umbilicalis]
MNTHRSGRLLWLGVIASGVAAHYGGKAYSRVKNAELAAKTAAYQERLAGRAPPLADAADAESPAAPDAPAAPAAAAAAASVKKAPLDIDVFADERRREAAAGGALSTAGVVVGSAAAVAFAFNAFSKNAAPNKLMHMRIVMQGLAVGGLAALAVKETVWDTRQERS